MNEQLYEAFEDCLQAIEAGADIDSVLKRYPQMVDDLRPLLEASLQAQSLVAPSVPEDAIRRGRARVLQHAAGMREAARNSSKSIFSFSRLATSLALALIFVLSGTELVRASNGALPGDNLYPVKRTWEDMRLLLVFDPEGREELEDEYEQERLEEIDELLVEGRHEMITFTGVVTRQDGDQWLVFNIPVQIMPDSQMPVEPVTLGATIMVVGRTNAQGFVEADRVKLLDAGASLVPVLPTEVEDSGNIDRIEQPGVEENNDNGSLDETEIESSSEDNQNDGSQDGGDEVKDSNDSSDDGESSNSGSSNKNNNSDDSSDDHSGSGSGDHEEGDD